MSVVWISRTCSCSAARHWHRLAVPGSAAHGRIGASSPRSLRQGLARGLRELLLSVILAVLATVAGAALASRAELQAGPVIVLVAAAGFLSSLLVPHAPGEVPDHANLTLMPTTGVVPTRATDSFWASRPAVPRSIQPTGERLIGREREIELIESFVASAAAEDALVVDRTPVLEKASCSTPAASRQRATDTPSCGMTGAEFEANLSYAGLHQLGYPFI